MQDQVVARLLGRDQGINGAGLQARGRALHQGLVEVDGDAGAHGLLLSIRDPAFGVCSRGDRARVLGLELHDGQVSILAWPGRQPELG
jgi:formylmethanofuran dehydrogenase subunit C